MREDEVRTIVIDATTAVEGWDYKECERPGRIISLRPCVSLARHSLHDDGGCAREFFEMKGETA